MTQHDLTSPDASFGSRHIDAFVTTGSSPGTSASPLRVHVLGVGAVGCALVERAGTAGLRIVGVSDSSASVLLGPDDHPRALTRTKRSGAPLSTQRGALRLPLSEILLRSDPDIVVDATPTIAGRESWYQTLEEGVLRAGRSLVLVSKDALCARGPSWLSEFGVDAVRYNAVLGGTGAGHAAALGDLRDDLRECAFAGNASTTTIIEVVEAGGTLEEGICVASERGVLEPDPELDLRGADALVKLAIVTGLISGESVDSTTLAPVDLRALDPTLLRRRRGGGATTRLVGRWRPGEAPRLAYEALPVDHPLAVATDRVVYRYALGCGRTIELEGAGLGADATAEAALVDLLALVTSASRTAIGGVR